MKDTPTILAFYSFKGGVGRSMALVNSAFALAAKGRHVLILDMDLEAPGLSGFLHRDKEIPRYAPCDILDLVSWARTVSLPLVPASYRPAAEYIVPIAKNDPDRIASLFGEFGRLDIIPADEERAYYDRLSELAIRDCDQQALVKTGSVLRAWLQSLRFPIEVPDYYGPDYPRSASYDYVLIDSRTGITEIGGLCIGPLSDQLVVLTAMNDQNVAGTRKFLIEVGVYEETGPAPGSKPCMIVASLVPAGEIEGKRERLKQVEQGLGDVSVKLSYHPQLALKETIFTRGYTDEYLAEEYEKLTREVLRSAGDSFDDNLLATAFKQPRSPSEFSGALTKLLRSTWSPGAAPFLAHLLSTTDLETLTGDSDFVLWDRVCRVLYDGDPSTRIAVFISWANVLTKWAMRTADAGLADLRFDAAMSLCEQILQSEEASPEQKSGAHFNRGLRHGHKGEPEKAIADYDSVMQIAASPAQKAGALVNRGAAFRQLGRPEKAFADYAAVIEMPDAPADRKALARSERGTMHLQISEPEKAIADYASCIQVLGTLTERQTRLLVVPSFAFGQQGGIADASPFHNVVIRTADEPARREDWLIKALLGRAAALKQTAQPKLATVDFTAVIDLPGATADQKCKAHLCRGFAYGEMGESQQAIADFAAVIQDFDPSPLERASALIGRGLQLDLLKQPKEAITDYGAVLEMSNAPADQKSFAVVYRGLSYWEAGQFEKAIDDLTAAIHASNIPVDQRARAQIFRGLAHEKRGELHRAMCDFTDVIDMKDVPVEERAQALMNRGVAFAEQRDFGSAIADYSAVVGMPDARADARARALLLRCISHSRQAEHDSAIADCTVVIELPGVSSDVLANACFYRGLAHRDKNESAKAIADMSAVIQMPADLAELKADALSMRGSIYEQVGELQKAIADFTLLLGLSAASPEGRAQNLGRRGLIYSKLGQLENAITDFTTVIETTEISGQPKSQALYFRGAASAQLQRLDDAMADYTAIIGMTEIPDELRSQALNHRGAIHTRRGEPAKAIGDYTTVIEMQGTNAKERAAALCSRGWLRFLAGRKNEAIEDEQQAISLNPEDWTPHANLAIALLVSGRTSDALAAYEVALGLSGAEGVDEMEKDIRLAIETYCPVSGADEAMTRLESRRKLLQQ